MMRVRILMCVCVTRCLQWRALTSVIIFPLVLFLSRWLALFCFCCSTRSLVVRYSRANSLRILQKRWILTSRTAYIGWPTNNRKAWNLQMNRETSHKQSADMSLGMTPTLKLAANSTETSDLHLNIPVDYSSMYNLQNNYSLCTVFEEVWHFLFQCWFHLMFCNDLEVIPWCFAPPLHLGQIVLKLIKVHLTWVSQRELTKDCRLSWMDSCINRNKKRIVFV